MSCNICCENYNKSSRAKIQCIYCDFDACRTCCETYLLSETTPKCMRPDCNKEWSRKFLRENFTNTFLSTKFRQHLEEVLFDKEKALMPDTQLIVEDKIRKRNIRTQIIEIDTLIDELVKQKSNLQRSLYDPLQISEKKQFVRRCPAPNCRGFLSSQWKCGICEQWTCPDCHELKGPIRDCEHTCDPNSIETAKLLSKDSKPCPKCQSLIFKISGCNQMWCTQCHTAFNWMSGKIETNIHNPHYYEWQRQNRRLNRNPEDIECGRELTHDLCAYIETLAKRHPGLYKLTHRQPTNLIKIAIHKYCNEINRLSSMIRHCVHNYLVELRQFQTDYVERNQNLRVKYLENSINEEDFKISIQRSDKKHRKNTEIAQVITLCNTAFTDIVYRIIDYLKQTTYEEVEPQHIQPFLDETTQLIEYCNDIFKDIAFTYGTIQYNLSSDMRLSRIEKKSNYSKYKI